MNTGFLGVRLGNGYSNLLQLLLLHLQAGEQLKDIREIHDAEGRVNVFPQRPAGGVQECDFFVKTGNCKFGQACHFHHPLSHSVKVSSNGGHPMRPGQAICPFYERTGNPNNTHHAAQ